MRRLIIIGTRGSALALWQANKVKKELEALKFICELKIIKTKGDKIQDLSFDKLEGKGFFTKEIEDALLEKEIDVAVHSLKDLPTEQPEGLKLSGLSERANPSDRLIIDEESYDKEAILGLKPKAIVGTSSIRRKVQLLAIRPDLNIKDLRGNVPTRVQKLREGNYDAIVLASAGLDRIAVDVSGLITKNLHPREFVPAPGQGVIAYQTRATDTEMRKIIANIHHKGSAECTNVERKVLQLMDGGCHIPLGAYCEKDVALNYHLYASYQAPGSTGLIQHKLSFSTSSMLAEKMVDILKQEKV